MSATLHLHGSTPPAIIPVIQPEGSPAEEAATLEAAYVDDGVMINSGPFNGEGQHRKRDERIPASRR